MFDRPAAEEVLNMTAQAVSKMRFCEIEDRYFAVEGQWKPVLERAALPLDQDVRRLNGRDAFLPRFGPGWRYALFTFGDGGELNGCLVLSSADPPDLSQLMQLRTVAETAGATQARGSTAQLPNGAMGQLLSPDDVAQRLPSLSARVLELEEHARIREALDQVTTPDLDSDSREDLLAEVLSQLTGRPICTEDAFGHIRATAGTGPKRPYPRLGAAARLRTAQLWRASGSPVREPRRLVALALSHGEVLGAMCMLETGRAVTAGNVFALKYATRLLEVELSHRRSLAQLELKLGRDLVDELVSGMDVATASVRTTALGYDISGPHHVIVAEWQPPRTDDTVVVALRRTLLALRSSALVSRRSDMAVAVVRGDPLGVEVFSVLAKTLRSATGAMGIGGPSPDVAQIPRSFSEALHALHVRAGSTDRYGVTRFDQLGIYRILATGGGEPDLAGYVDEWLGTLQRADKSRGSDLVHTLAQYLDHGGNYDSSAESLTIHRSTLRYRLKSIRQITGFDLADPETRLNLHVATRAWRLRPHAPLTPHSRATTYRPTGRGRRGAD
ncbi:CdaR family transcriptional regulator [Arthrobacter sp. PM3]|uniref:PucR family transcriptional regulator n=1 Tax=Arthrobacter sp. PM3 TaxID=2017685 RepID=UPI000E101B11|nr:helix-turn-helix domain-containing protein [Arthrobacter sp. PM3]AXJ11683.1 PucR family transcriptional regulator [Arthrobacter sp. PM3]